MYLRQVRLLLAVIILLLAACTLNTAAPTTLPPTETSATGQPMLNDIPLVGYTDIEPSGVAGCVLRNSGTAPVNIYAGSSADLSVIALLQPGTGVPGYEYENGFYHVNFTVYQTEVVGWIAAAETAVEGDCLEIQPPAGCSVQPSVGRVIDIYAQPDRNSQLVSALNERYFLPFIQLNADHWFKVDLGGGQSGWIAPDEGKLVGGCD